MAVQSEMFPEKCFRAGCRNKVRVYVPEVTRDRPIRVEGLPSCVKHADEMQQYLLAVNASLVWALRRQLGSPDT